MVHLVKRLLGEGCQIRIWDPNVSLGQLIGSNRQFIQEAIPHIGSLLRGDVREVADHADVLVIASRTTPSEAEGFINDRHIVINVAKLERTSQKPALQAVAAG